MSTNPEPGVRNSGSSLSASAVFRDFAWMRDPVVLAGLVAGVAVCVLSAFDGRVSTDSSTVTFACYAVFLLLAGTASWMQARGASSPSERRFWGLVTIAMLFWLVAAVPFLLSNEFYYSNLILQTLIDVAFALYYVALVLAAEQRPERGPELSKKDLDHRLEVWGLHFFVLGLVLYFVLIPNIFGPQIDDMGRPIEGYVLFLALDIYLFLRFVYLFSATKQVGWKVPYALLAGGHFLWSFTDIFESLTRLPGSTLEITTWLNPLWYLPFLLVLAAARFRSAQTEVGQTSEAEFPEHGPRRLVLFLFILVLIHLGVGLLGGIDRAGYGSRGILTIGLALGLGVLAQIQYRNLDLRNRRLHELREVVLADLQRSEETLQEHNELLRDFNKQLTTRVSERTAEVRQTRDIALMTLAKLTESRDYETGRHLERIALFSERLAEVLSAGVWQDRVSGDFVEELRRSSPLHDIGKVGIPDAILLNAGPLTVNEMEVMRRHTTIGGDTLSSIVRDHGGESVLRMAMEVAYSHHEKWSGFGYPKGLAGEEIPLSARIVALVDAYDAMTSVRPYKTVISHEIAVGRIVQDSGRHFDPDVVDAFLTCKDEFPAITERIEVYSESEEGLRSA
ncbi:MAG: hypothetical protein DRJ61_11955 [Acidobacteria bacterium]|nr:MAG: hypothetical protein DRJ61_11955 [Acidobacteriota bacterium]